MQRRGVGTQDKVSRLSAAPVAQKLVPGKLATSMNLQYKNEILPPGTAVELIS